MWTLPIPSPVLDPSVWGLTGIGPGHCKVLLILLPGNTWSCAEPGPGLPQPQGQRGRTDGQGGTDQGESEEGLPAPQDSDPGLPDAPLL